MQRSSTCFESNDVLGPVHDGAVGANRSPDDIVGVLEVDDDGLGGRVGFGVDLSHANVLVGLECLGLPSAYLHLVHKIE